MSRWIIGNLDCETSWAREAGWRAGRRVRPLPEHVIARIALYATLLRVFAEEGDTIWTPRPIDPRCVRPVAGLPEVRWADGDLPAEAFDEEPLAWGRAWPLELSDEQADVMLTVANKCWQWREGAEPGWQLPGSRVIGSVDELEQDRPNDWIAKAPYGAAGRGRVRGSGSSLRMEARRGVERLIEDHGEVLLEPWIARTEDFGCWKQDPAEQDCAFHDLEVDGSGRFRGIRVGGGRMDPEQFLRESPLIVHSLIEAAVGVSKLLAANGYDGPYGFDGFRYVDGAGNERVHAPCEINPRLTFGRVAYEYRERVGATRLRFGHEPEHDDDEHVVPLLGSPTEPIMYAWLEREPA